VRIVLTRTIQDVRKHLELIRRQNKRIGLVPTMGALHAGHASLIERARSDSAFVTVSIFVNPLQFGPNEDYLRYPRPLEGDLEICENAGVDLVFAPEVTEVYASEQRTFVEVSRLGDHLCGAFRPGHFRGVATVVAKLFNIAYPDRAYFGEKDYQQLAIIRRMVKDLNFGVEIVAVPTYREPDGLALSSRNAYMSPSERALSPVVFQTLRAAKTAIEQGERRTDVIKGSAIKALSRESGVRVQYFEIVDPLEVQPVAEIHGEVRVACAVFIGNTRLIDNIAAVSPE
jgi:pantoate--beta-alanine ligase